MPNDCVYTIFYWDWFVPTVALSGCSFGLFELILDISHTFDNTFESASCSNLLHAKPILSSLAFVPRPVGKASPYASLEDCRNGFGVTSLQKTAQLSWYLVAEQAL